MSEINWYEAIKMYNSGYGTSYIGEKFNTPSNTIRRGLIKRGIKLRSRSEAQKLSLERIEHPMKGKQHSQATKRKIGEQIHNKWESLSDEKKEECKKRSKERWESLTEEQKAEINSQAAIAVRKASKEGSALEKFLLNKIREVGYDVQWHLKETLENENLEIDLALPGLKIAIEVDGPCHHKVVYSKEQFRNTLSADKTKNGLLLKNGYCVIRVNNSRRNTSNYLFEKLWEKLHVLIQSIVDKFPNPEDRLIQIEV